MEGTKAVINSTITPNMTFTKTSQKFGQWSDVRANTVYGLGFSSDGSTLIAGSDGITLRIMRAASLEEVAEAERSGADPLGTDL